MNSYIGKFSDLTPMQKDEIIKQLIAHMNLAIQVNSGYGDTEVLLVKADK